MGMQIQVDLLHVSNIAFIFHYFELHFIIRPKLTRNWKTTFFNLKDNDNYIILYRFSEQLCLCR